MKTLVTGATGFVGRRLLARLDRPVVLSRDARRARAELAEYNVTAYDWDVSHQSPPAEAFDGVEAVVHLAGESVGQQRWTKARKRRIRESRVAGTRRLVQTLAELETKPKVFIAASAVGYYGSRGETELDESACPGDDFLSEVCTAWEAESQKASELDVRTIVLRIGMVVGLGGGAMGKMLFPFRLGLGSPMGNGRQWMPWIHIDDLIGIILHAVRNPQLAGVANAVAPNSVTNRQFTKTLGKVLARPTLLPPVPGFVLRLMIGQFAEVLLSSQRAVCNVLQREGYEFQYPELEAALRAVVDEA